MKRIIAALLLAMFSAAVIGCEASARVGDPDLKTTNTNSSSYKKTTVTRPDGDTTIRTERRID